MSSTTPSASSDRRPDYPSSGLSPVAPSVDSSDQEHHVSSRPSLPVEEDVFQLARLGEISAIQKLFDSGKSDANAKDEQGVTPLHFAAYRNHYALCHFLITAGADVNAKGGEVNATPILWAARNCHYYIVHLLLQNGADPLRTDDQGFNLLQNATLDGNVFQLLLLLYQDVPVDTPDANGHTSLMWAAYKGYPACVEVLLLWGASVAATDEHGFTALHWALVKGSYPCIQKLIEYGSDRSKQTSNGKTPSTVAQEMSTVSQWRRALAENRYNPDGSPMPFPFHSYIKDYPLFVTRSCFLWPFIMIPSCIYILSVLPIFAGAPLAAITFFAMQWLLQRFLQWAPANLRRLDYTPFLAGVFGSTLFWVLIQYMFQILPATLALCPFTHLVFVLLACCCSYFYILAMTEDPGYIPKGGSRREQKDVVLDLIQKELFDERHFCVKCSIRKPQRSKHCSRCRRCVAKHDHHCPWVNNCVAVNNHRHFILFLVSMEVGIIFLIRLALQYIWIASSNNDFESCNILSNTLCGMLNADPFTVLLVIWTSLHLSWVSMLIFVQLVQIARATTTYESMRGHRQLSPAAEAVTSTITAGTTSLDAAGLTARGSGPTAVAPQPGDRQRGCLAQWKSLFGIDVFMATAAKEARGGGAHRAQALRNPFTRGLLGNFKDFFCDPMPVYKKPENGAAMLGGQRVNYTDMYDVPARTRGGYSAIGTEDNV